MNTIELYTGKGCSACVTLKERLLELGITNYEPRSTDVMEHRDAIMHLGFRSIPVLVKRDADGEVLGFMNGNAMCDTTLTNFFKEGEV